MSDNDWESALTTTKGAMDRLAGETLRWRESNQNTPDGLFLYTMQLPIQQLLDRFHGGERTPELLAAMNKCGRK